MDVGNTSSRTQQEFELRPCEEFRFELLEGTAELGGYELTGGTLSKPVEYTLSNFSGFLFTWHGCKISVDGTCERYIVQDTFMRTILNTHADLSKQRQKAALGDGPYDDKCQGPKVMVMGPPGSGKSTVCLTLANYAARVGEKLAFVDLCVSCSSITIPGLISAVVMDKPVLFPKGWGKAEPLSLWTGTSTDSDLFDSQLKSMVSHLESRDQLFADAKASGWIIKSPIWSDHKGYQLVLKVVDMIKPNLIIVLGYDKLEHDLDNLYHDRISSNQLFIVNVARSGGLVYRGPQECNDLVQQRIREYFYGSSREFGPRNISLPYPEKFCVVEVKKQDQISLTALPIGAEATLEEAKLEVVPVAVDRTIRHSILAISYAKELEEVISSNILGYLHVIDVDLEKKKLGCLSPTERIQLGKEPRATIYLILTGLKYADV